MNIVNSALTEVRTATREINDMIDTKRQEIAKLEKRLHILTTLRVSMEDAVDDLAAVDAATNQHIELGEVDDDKVVEIDADVDLDDTAAL